MKTVSLTEATAKLSALVDEADTAHEIFQLTRHGRAAAASCPPMTWNRSTKPCMRYGRTADCDEHAIKPEVATLSQGERLLAERLCGSGGDYRDSVGDHRLGERARRQPGPPAGQVYPPIRRL
jgi:hypothetical protein